MKPVLAVLAGAVVGAGLFSVGVVALFTLFTEDGLAAFLFFLEVVLAPLVGGVAAGLIYGKRQNSFLVGGLAGFIGALFLALSIVALSLTYWSCPSDINPEFAFCGVFFLIFAFVIFPAGGMVSFPISGIGALLGARLRSRQREMGSL